MGPPNSATETPGRARAAAPGGEGRRESPYVSARRGRSPPATGRLLSAPRVPPHPTPAARVAAPPAPPLVAAARLGAPTPRGFSSTRLPDPAGGLRGAGPWPHPPRAVRPPRSCQSCGHEEGERPPSGPFGPSRDAVGRDVPKRRPGGVRLLLPRPRGPRNPRSTRMELGTGGSGRRRHRGRRGGLGGGWGRGWAPPGRWTRPKRGWLRGGSAARSDRASAELPPP